MFKHGYLQLEKIYVERMYFQEVNKFLEIQ